MGILIRILIGIVVSFYIFPISFTFLPGINTKAILAVLGAICFFLDYGKLSSIKLNINLLFSTIIAAVFSLICLISADINHTDDYSYATYIASFFVWISGAYFVGFCIRIYHGKFSFKSLTLYLLSVSMVQCILALMIDNIPGFQTLVDSVVEQGQNFYQRVERLYGIGAALDSAGVRFAVVLILTSALLSHDKEIRKSNALLIYVLVSFFLITIVGNMISRTTMVGMIPALAYFVFFSGLFRIKIFFDSIKLGVNFAFILLLAVMISTYLYLNNDDFYINMRFAFEGFFSWIETGEWRTGSTDKLHSEMWIWPEDLNTWIIGTGIFGSFVYSTDIGYCRFILYCGIVGFSSFALLFIYNTFVFIRVAKNYWMMFLILGALTFIIWIKVSTDIFFIYALFYSIDEFIAKSDKFLTASE